MIWKEGDGRTGEREDEKQKTHLRRHILISRREIDYERVVRLEVCGIRVWLGLGLKSRKRVSFTLQGGESTRTGLDKGKGNGSRLGRDRRLDIR